MATDGDLDPSFGEDGRVTTVFPVGSFATAVAIQDDGKIVAVGAAAGPSGTGEFALARYEEDGGLDPSFGEGGMVTTAIAGGGGDEARSVAIQENGRIVVAGADSWQRFAVVRYRPNGQLDDSFGGGDGIVRTNFTPGDDMAWDVVLQRDGKIVAVGGAGFGHEGFQIARYQRDGTLDPTFGEGGKVVTRYRDANARAVALQPNGRILVTGTNVRWLALARYRPDGRLDRSFSGNGMVGVPLGMNILPHAVALQRDGRIVVAGGFDYDHIGLARFLDDGRLDRSFGGDGIVRRKVEGEAQAANGLILQPDGRIVVTGWSGPHEAEPTVFRFIMIRVLPDGRLDQTFGDRGRVATFFDGGAFAYGAAADHEGRVVIVGGAGEGNRDAFALARYVV